VALEKKMWRFHDSAGTKNQEFRGTHHVTPPFAKNLVVQISFLFNSFLSVPYFIEDSR